MANTTTHSITYPVTANQVTPLANVFAALADSTDAALTRSAITRVGSAAARNALFPSPTVGDRVYRTDLGYTETWYPANFFVTGAAAGWQREGGDSGWISITPGTGWALNSGAPVRVRRQGGIVTMTGIMDFVAGSYANMGTIPAGARPVGINHMAPVTIRIGTTGYAGFSTVNAAGLLTVDLTFAGNTSNPNYVGFGTTWQV